MADFTSRFSPEQANYERPEPLEGMSAEKESLPETADTLRQAASARAEAGGLLADLEYAQREELKMVEQAASEIDVSPDELEAGLGKSMLLQTFKEIRETARSLFERFKKGIAIGVGASLLVFQAGDLRKIPEIAVGAKAIAQERLPEPKLRAEQIRQLLLTDVKERAMFSTDLDPNQNFIELAQGSKDSAFFDFEKIDRQTSPEAKAIRIAHTHPWEAYKSLGYSNQQVQDMREGRFKPAPLPPSILDIMAAESLRSYFEEQKRGLKITSQIYDPTGIWEFRLDPSSKFTQDLKKSLTDLDKYLKEFINSLSPEDKAYLQSRNLNKMSQVEKERFLQAKPRIASGLEEIVEQLEDRYENTSEVLGELEFLAHKIRTANRSVGWQKDIPELIENYLGYCRRNGINMTYRPYSEAPKRDLTP